jgi:hypothetical protein
MRSPCWLYLRVRLSVSVYPPLSAFQCLSQYLRNFIYHGTWAHLSALFHKSLPSVCVSVCVSPPIVNRQRLGKQVPAAKNRRNNTKIIERVIYYAVRVIWRESQWVCLCTLPIVARQFINKHVPTAKNCWRCLICGPCRIRGEWLVLPVTACLISAWSLSLSSSSSSSWTVQN